MSDLTTHAHDLSHHTSDHLLAVVSLPPTGVLDLGTSDAGGVPIPGMIVTMPAGDPRPYEVHFGAHLYTETATQTAILQLREDGNAIAEADFTNYLGPSATRTVRWRRRRLPALMSHTYSLYIRSYSGTPAHALGYATAGQIFIEALAL